ncbi:hypothetical protein E2C01_044923 [Portunus trituberculatus]|uniref:Uncharacterized protein n=1 Tax=Portunus trituberculatus TaxID=210409 RepID=A0A5B7G0N1_PORTR|nr:hypothetical protein [Portunus trituberculatus]
MNMLHESYEQVRPRPLFHPNSWSSPSPTVRPRPPPPLLLREEMAESHQDEDMTQLVTSMLSCALSDEEPPVDLAQLRQRVGSLPILQEQPHHPEVPQQSSSLGGPTRDDELLEAIRDLRRRRSTRPKVIIPRPSFGNPAPPARRRSDPPRLSQASQTIAPAIKKMPEETRSFPVPWGRRLRTVSVETQTENFASVVRRRHHAVPSWDPMPEEMFVMDDVSDSPLNSWSMESSFDTPRQTNVSSNKYADTTFLNISFEEVSLSDLASNYASLSQPRAASWSSALPSSTDVEVVHYSVILQNRTVATNTDHVGWRRSQKIHRNRVRSRGVALGWSSHPETASVATQTSP